MSTRAAAKTFDVAIIGGGLAGVATAYFLSRLGVNGVIVERHRQPATHASGNNAGMFRGQLRDPMLKGLADRSRVLLETLHPQLLDPCGGLLLYDREQGRRYTHRASELRARFPALRSIEFGFGSLAANDGTIQPQRMVGRLLSLSCARHFELITSFEVNSVADDRGYLRLRSHRQQVRARLVVNAAGAWADQVALRCGARALGLEAWRRHLWVLPRVRSLSGSLPYIWHEDRSYYLRPDGDTLLVSFCDGERVDPNDHRVDQPDQTVLARLHQQAQSIAAELSPQGARSVRCCLRTFAPHSRPVLGWDQHQPALFWMAALGGSGLTTSLALGECAAAQIAERLAHLGVVRQARGSEESVL